VLSERKRDMLFQEIKEKALCWFIAFATVEEIDELNILQATLLAMQRAVNGLAIQPEQVLVDGNQLPKLLMHAQAIIKGDSKVQAISAASILAKVERDRLMVNLDKEYPQFTFGQHKGYGTKQHLNEIEMFGVLPVHRKSFKPIKTMLTHL
jgi:ribonuclease HII